MTREKELLALHESIRNCTLCPLHKTRTQAVPGEGPVHARIMFIGEAPGVQEDATGRPFVGRSGELLTEMIESIGLTRERVFITSVLKSRPPNNRTPTQSEIEACRPYIDRQIELIDPRIVVLLGGVAISSIVGPWKVSDSHGDYFEAKGRIFFMTYHPAAALRFPKAKALMKSDFEVLRSLLV
ncbi:MAG: uracil-DNA glycosylase [Candidatus Thorarchaeota archaeon]|nr:uracil-DNA glycosylase [Candidatus Thorarchaeota archaeon]